MELLKGKPTSITAVKSEASYDEIMSAIHHGQIPDKTLRAVVTTCKANPERVMFVVYKALPRVFFLFLEKNQFVWNCKVPSYNR